MGVSFVGASVHFSYGEFNRFRERLAKGIGLDLNLMDGYSKGSGQSWDTVKDDLVPFLNHSDMDGMIGPEHCKRIALRLYELTEDWDDSDFQKQQAVKLIIRMADCGDTGQSLVLI